MISFILGFILGGLAGMAIMCLIISSKEDKEWLEEC